MGKQADLVSISFLFNKKEMEEKNGRKGRTWKLLKIEGNDGIGQSKQKGK